MLDKARIATDPLSHNPTVYYKQAKYFSNQQEPELQRRIFEGFVATFGVNDRPIYMALWS